MKFFNWLICAGLCCTVLSVSAQSRNKAYEDYIKKYRGIAVDEMKHYRIPASITLAQGLLERACWPASRTITSESNVEVPGTDLQSDTMTMRPTSVSAPINMRVIRTVTIPSFCVREPVMPSCSV